MDSGFIGCLAAAKSVPAHYSCAKKAWFCDSCCYVDACSGGLGSVFQFMLAA